MRTFDPNDPRPLRVTIFPEHPQTILICVPEGQSLWLPDLPTPFNLDRLCDALDDHDIPHETLEGDTGRRWTEAVRRMENEERSTLSQQHREATAARQVSIRLSPDATTSEKQRAETVLIKQKVDDEIRTLKIEVARSTSLAKTRGGQLSWPLRQKQQRLADLQTTSLALQNKLSNLRRAIHIEHESRDSRRSRDKSFIEKAKRYLTKEQYLGIWAEIEAEVRAIPVGSVDDGDSDGQTP